MRHRGPLFGWLDLGFRDGVVNELINLGILACDQAEEQAMTPKLI